jgi:integrase
VRTLDELAELERRYLDLASAAPRTQNSHARHWPRFERWCERRGIDPMTATSANCAEFVREDFKDTTAKSTYTNYLRAIRWMYHQANLPDPTSASEVKHAVSERVRAASKLPKTDQKRARPMTPNEAIAVLAFPPPAPSSIATLTRANFTVCAALGLAFNDAQVASLPHEAITVRDGVLQVGDIGELGATGDEMTCPVSAWIALESVAPPGRRLAIGSLHAYRQGPWKDVGRSKATGFATSALSTALRQCQGSESRLSKGVALAEQFDAETRRRIWMLLDHQLASHVRSSAIVALQVWGGFRSSDIARLTVKCVVDEPDALLLHLPWQKNDQNRRGQTRAIPTIPNHPDICGATAIRRWLWLAAERQREPVIPHCARYSVLPPRLRPFDADKNGPNTSTAMSGPVQERLIAAGFDATGVASHSGRKTLTTLAIKGGASLREVRDHLGQRTSDVTYQYFDSGDVNLSDPWSASNQMSWEQGR